MPRIGDSDPFLVYDALPKRHSITEEEPPFIACSLLKASSTPTPPFSASTPFFLGEDGGEKMQLYASWNEAALELGAPLPTITEIIEALDLTWQCMADCLARWNSDDIQYTVSDEWGGHQRAWVVWHVIEHDLHHGGEISLTLGIHGIPSDFPG